ncbi:MAG: hypothetical protein ACC661_04500 [Verrucomicrobiales bacterium]
MKQQPSMPPSPGSKPSSEEESFPTGNGEEAVSAAEAWHRRSRKFLHLLTQEDRMNLVGQRPLLNPPPDDWESRYAELPKYP